MMPAGLERPPLVLGWFILRPLVISGRIMGLVSLRWRGRCLGQSAVRRFVLLDLPDLSANRRLARSGGRRVAVALVVQSRIHLHGHDWSFIAHLRSLRTLDLHRLGAERPPPRTQHGSLGAWRRSRAEAPKPLEGIDQTLRVALNQGDIPSAAYLPPR